MKSHGRKKKRDASNKPIPPGAEQRGDLIHEEHAGEGKVDWAASNDESTPSKHESEEMGFEQKGERDRSKTPD